jgi:hypothetical protein
MAGKAQDPASARGDELVGRGEQAEPQPAGFQRRLLPVRASTGIQAPLSRTIWTISNQMPFCALWCRGRLRSPVARAARMRSSALARSRRQSSS